jgi:hypothetical protein
MSQQKGKHLKRKKAWHKGKGEGKNWLEANQSLDKAGKHSAKNKKRREEHRDRKESKKNDS